MPRRNNGSATVMAVSETLKLLKLNTMAASLCSLDESGQLSQLSGLELIRQLADEQYLASENKISERYKKSAHFYWPQADLSDIDYRAERHINVPLMKQLATNEYIRQSRNIFISSEAGCGKTYIACARGNNACEAHFTAKYFDTDTLMDFFDEAHQSNQFVKRMRKLSNTNLIIIDDFLLTTINAQFCDDLIRLIKLKPRNGKSRSFIICTQLMKEEIYARLSAYSAGLAEAIMDRISHGTYDIELKGESMRKILSEEKE